MNSNKNPIVELWRILFALLIIISHTPFLPWATEGNGLFRSPALAVDFFFVLSGFLMAKSVEKKVSSEGESTRLGDETLQFLWDKLKAIYPTYIFALCVELLVSGLVAPAGGKTLLDYTYYVWDFLFVRLAGLQGYSSDMVVGGTWYLSAMILAMWILYPLLRKYTNMFLRVIAPLLSLFIFGWFSNVYGKIKFQLDFTDKGLSLGLVRAVAEICFGCAAYSFYCLLKKHPPKKQLFRLLATVVEFGAMLFVLWMAKDYWRSRIDFICILLIGVSLAISFSGVSYTGMLAGKISLPWAGKLSLSLYLNHYVWVRMLARLKLPIPFGQQVLITFALSIVTAILCMFTISLVSQLIQKVKKRS